MAKVEVTCKISCQKCDWNVGATIPADEANVLEEVLKLIKECSHQHSSSGLAGELLVAWQPLESTGR